MVTDSQGSNRHVLKIFGYLSMIFLIKTRTKWVQLCGRHLQIHFSEWKFWISWISTMSRPMKQFAHNWHYGTGSVRRHIRLPTHTAMYDFLISFTDRFMTCTVVWITWITLHYEHHVNHWSILSTMTKRCVVIQYQNRLFKMYYNFT